MEIFGYPEEIFIGYHRNILGYIYWISNGISQGQAQEIFLGYLWRSSRIHQDIMGDLGWILYGISLGETKEISLGDIKDKSGYHQDIAGRSMLEMEWDTSWIW